MVLGVLSAEIEIPHAESLKDKRRVLNRVKERLRSFNVSVAEVGANDVWNYAEIGVAAVSNDARHANQTLSSVSKCLQEGYGFVLVDFSTEFIHV